MLQERGAAFASTHWSVVLLTAQSQAPEAAQAAMTGFCQTYWPPLYTFLRRRGRSPSDAQDLTQAFFAHLLEQNTLALAIARLTPWITKPAGRGVPYAPTYGDLKLNPTWDALRGDERFVALVEQLAPATTGVPTGK